MCWEFLWIPFIIYKSFKILQRLPLYNSIYILPCLDCGDKCINIKACVLFKENTYEIPKTLILIQN